MAKYTLELRKLETELTKVFDFDYDFYVDDENIKKNFENKFLNMYAFDEIGFETIQRFKFNLRSKLNSIMPYYKQLYQTELASKKIDMLLNKDYIEKYTRELESSNNSTMDSILKSTGSNDNILKSNFKESSANNGLSSVTLEANSLTSVNQDDSTNKSTLKNDSNTKSINGSTGKILETTTNEGKGNIGVTKPSEMLEGWRKILINIDMLILNECFDLFMRVY